MTASNLDDLIQRVEAATGPDRELDAAIEWWIAGDRNRPERTNADHQLVAEKGAAAFYDQQHEKFGGINFRYRPPPHVVHVLEWTASIDAALALVEKVLGKRDWTISVAINSYGEAIIRRGNAFILSATETSGDYGDSDEGKPPAIAIILALLRGLKQQEDRP